MPGNLYDAAHSPEMACLLTVALILDRSAQHIERQMTLVEEHMGAGQSRMVRGYQEDIAKLGAEYRLPLLGLAFPALKRRPAAHVVELAELAHRLAEIDGIVDLYEICFNRILLVNLRNAIDPSADRMRMRGSRPEVAQAAVNVLATVAQQGHEDPTAAQAALDAGTALLGKWTASVKVDLKQKMTADILTKSLNLLLVLKGRQRRKLLRAICESAAHDGHLNIAEVDLIRVVCATLEYPLPPILVDDSCV